MLQLAFTFIFSRSINKEKMKLSKFTNISSGVVITSKNKQAGVNGPIIIQGSDIREDGISDPDYSLKEHGNLSNQALTVQDVLLVSRGDQNKAIPVTEKQVGMVASNSFLVIRVLGNQGVMQEYLAWFLNSDLGQKRLSEIRRGSNIMYISKKGLSGIEVDVPDMKSQKIVVEIERLKKHEQKILRKISSGRRKLIDQVLFNFIQRKKS